jgi:hypothetical protein
VPQEKLGHRENRTIGKHVAKLDTFLRFGKRATRVSRGQTPRSVRVKGLFAERTRGFTQAVDWPFSSP